MALTEQQRKGLADEARRKGYDVDEFVAEAEAESAGDDEKPEKSTGPNGKGEVGFYAFQHPYMTVNEIRESMGLPSIPDGGAFSGDWLAKHGGGKSAPTDGEA